MAAWVVAGTLFLAAGAARAGTIVGEYDGGNCYPFSCFASDGGGSTYQQVYSASAFSGAFSITSISFFLDTAGNMDSADYEISFSTTSAAVSGLDSTWANNIGGDSAVFGNFSLSGAMPAVLTFTGTPFYYDPSAGNLLMTVQVSNLTEVHSYESFFQADYTGIDTQRQYAYGGSATGTGSDLGALRTEFNGTTVVPLPPAAFLGLGLLGGLGVVTRLRRRKPAAIS